MSLHVAMHAVTVSHFQDPPGPSTEHPGAPPSVNSNFRPGKHAIQPDPSTYLIINEIPHMTNNEPVFAPRSRTLQIFPSRRNFQSFEALDFWAAEWLGAGFRTSSKDTQQVRIQIQGQFVINIFKKVEVTQRF